jgi:60 kDa SS-A/Ro ribonucleoprotein
MRVNTATERPKIYTYEGGRATPTDMFHQLKRSVLTCMLYESSFYEDKFAPAQRIVELVPQCEPAQVAALAVEARDRMNLRSVPLFLVRQLARIKGQGPLVRETLAHVIQRPDELSEFLAMYWQDGKQPLTRGVKCGLAKAFTKFDPYQIAKWNRDNQIKLRDVLFMVHGKPSAIWNNDNGTSMTQAELWKKLVEGTLEPADTWEVALSGGADPKETFERLIRQDNLGGLAWLKNLRNMQNAGVDRELLEARIRKGAKRAFPYRFVVAAKYAPTYEEAIEAGMFKAIEGLDELPGTTGLLIDVSGSMDEPLGKKPDAKREARKKPEKDPTTRIDVAAGLAILLREKASRCFVATFSDALMDIPARRGFALRDAIIKSQPHSGTHLGAATAKLRDYWAGKIDRLIIITDEQSQDGICAPPCALSYVINVASYQHGVSYRNGYQHIDGWSERCIDYIRETELMLAAEYEAKVAAN